jgi:ubiquinone/menaquinone biosynthesis C-methylase UbiE
VNVNKYEEWCQFYDPSNEETKFLKDILNLKDSGVLEIGCGTGRLSYRIADSVKSLCAIDKEEKAIDICKGKQSATNPKDNITFSVQDACLMEFPFNSFDIVIFSWSIYLIGNKRKVIKDVWRFLKQDGHIVVVQPIGGLFEEILMSHYKSSNLEQFISHNLKARENVSQVFGNYAEYQFETDFLFPGIEKTIEMMEFFIEDEDNRSFTDNEKNSLTKKLKPFQDIHSRVRLSDVVNIIVAKKRVVVLNEPK